MPEFFNTKEHKLFKFSYKRLIILILVAIAIYFLVPKLVGAKEGIKLLQKVKPIYLFFCLVAEFISYVGAAFLVKLVLKRLKYNLRFLDTIRMGTIGAFAIHFFPVSGAGEAAINYYILRAKKVSQGDALFIFIIRGIFFYTAFFLLFALGSIIIPTHPHLSIDQKIVGIILFAIIISFTLWIRYLYRHKYNFWSVGYKFLGMIKWLSKKILKKRVFSGEVVEIIVSDIYNGFHIFSKGKMDWFPATGWAMVYWLADMSCLFFSLLAFGYLVNPGVLIFAYCIATLAGLLSFIPGGVGVLDGTLSLGLIGLGVPTGLALFAVLLYRFFSFWLLMPVGFLSFLTLRSEIANDKRNSRLNVGIPTTYCNRKEGSGKK